MTHDGTSGSRPGEHAVYPGSFDPLTPGHLDIIGRARHLFARVTVLVAVNRDKRPGGTESERAIRLRRELPAEWGNVSVAAWPGLTVEFCRGHDGGCLVDSHPRAWSSADRAPGWLGSRRADEGGATVRSDNDEFDFGL